MGSPKPFFCMVGPETPHRLQQTAVERHLARHRASD